MGQRVVTSLNHLDLKKIKIKIIIMQIKKGEKSTRRGIIFWSQKRIHVGRNEEKKTERESREEEKIDSPVFLFTN